MAYADTYDEYGNVIPGADPWGVNPLDVQQAQTTGPSFTPDPTWLAGPAGQSSLNQPAGQAQQMFDQAGPVWNKDARNQVRDSWMSGSGSLEDFIKNSPYASHLHSNNDILTIDQTPDDKYQWGPEQIDAVGDYGGANKHNWTRFGPGSGGGMDPNGGDGAGGNGGPGGALNIPPVDPELMGMFKSMANRSSNTQFSDDLLNAISKTLKDGPTAGPMSAQQFEAIRQPIEKGRRAQTNQAMGELANRGLLGEGAGHQQGPERTALDRIESTIAPDWSTALQNASVDNAKLSTGLFENAMNTGAQTKSAMDQNALGALKGAADYQGMNADVALRGLDQNRMWNQFLAQFGLDREKTMADIQNGNMQNLIPLLQLFQDQNNTSSNGYIQ